MVDLYDVETFNADTGFKADYLNELERMLEKFLPHAMLKAKSNLESRFRTMKRDWAIVYDMLSGKDNSDFGWHEYMQLVVVLNAVWNSFISFRHRSFLYYDQLTTIDTTDRAIGKNAQTNADIIEEIDAEDIAIANTHEERNDFHGCEANVSLDEMDLSATQTQPSRNQDDSTFSKKTKRIYDTSEQISSTSFTDAATLLTENIQTVGLKISRSIASEVLIQQK
ncbi:hypothetical protein Golob_024261 [Gossypium lobatum]|uniref:Myb/SANT-like domain-containing protein n=1 Tax=Gossypium lobatum TaxID=34289 RepID=A0A7J8NGS9_9ROSI|nr:hypothetical protein [Gossypium lobatum]